MKDRSDLLMPQFTPCNRSGRKQECIAHEEPSGFRPARQDEPEEIAGETCHGYQLTGNHHPKHCDIQKNLNITEHRVDVSELACRCYHMDSANRAKH